MAGKFERFVNAYHKAYTIYYREIEGCPIEERDEVWDLRYEFIIALMKRLRRILQNHIVKPKVLVWLWVFNGLQATLLKEWMLSKNPSLRVLFEKCLIFETALLHTKRGTAPVT